MPSIYMGENTEDIQVKKRVFNKALYKYLQMYGYAVNPCI